MADLPTPTGALTTPIGPPLGATPFVAEEFPAGLLEDLRRTFEPRYQLLGMLGRGGMGVVLEAWDPVLERSLAIKILTPEASLEDSTARERLLREARAAATLSHPNVVSVFGVGETQTLHAPYILMQRVMGETLDRIESEGPSVDVPTAVRILGDVAEALTAAHARGLVHRDLKPSNVIVEAQTGRAVVLDFGISAFSPTPGRREVKLTATGMYLGTPLYMSPEQSMGEQATEKSDIYSLGCMMYELLAGRRVFDGESAMAVMAAHIKDTPAEIRNIRADVPETLARTLMGMLAKVPNERPTADDLRRQFAPVPDTHPWSATRLSGLRAELRRLAAIGVALALLMGYALYRIPLGERPLEGFEGAFSVVVLVTAAVLFLAYALQGAWCAHLVWRAQVPARLIGLLAGDGPAEVGRMVDRLERFATAEQGRLAEVIERKRALGAALLASGPLALVLLAIVALAGAGNGSDGSVVVLAGGVPILGLLWAKQRHDRLARKLRGSPQGPGSGTGQGPLDRPIIVWLKTHAKAVGWTPTPIRRSLLWSATALPILVVGAVLALVGLVQFVVAAHDFFGNRDLDVVRANRRRNDLVLALAAPVGPPIDSILGRRAWDSLYPVGDDTLKLGPSSPRVNESNESSVVTFFPGLPGDPRSRGDPIIAAMRGLTAAQRRYLDSAAADPLVDALLTAARTTGGAPTQLRELADLRSGRSYWWWSEWGRYMRRAERNAELRVALAVAKGDRDGAVHLLRALLQVGAIRARDARTDSEWGAASGVAVRAVEDLRMLDQHWGRPTRWPDPGPPPNWRGSGVIPDIGTPPRLQIADTTLPVAIRWAAIREERFRSCTRPAALWADRDPGFDSVEARAYRHLVVSPTDSEMVAAYRGLLNARAKWLAAESEVALLGRAMVRFALLFRHELLAGCVI